MIMEPHATNTDLTILIVDDSPLSGRLCSTIIGKMGHTPIWVDSGTEALDVLRQQHVDLALLDLRLPGMSGIELARFIRSGQVENQNPEIMLVALTGSENPERRHECLEAGMNEYLTKPLDINALHEIITQGFTEPDDEYDLHYDETALFGWDRMTALSKLGDNPELLAQMDGIYLETVESEMDELFAAVENKDMQEAKRLAHLIKSSARTVGAVQVSLLAEELEALTQQKEDSGLISATTKLAQVLNDSIGQLTVHTSGDKMSGENS